MFIRTGLATIVVSLLATLPAHAVFCTGGNTGVIVSFGVHLGEDYTEEEINDFDLMALRQQGVDATAVERWNGCIRAFVRTPTGEEMQFFEPDTYERVQ